MKTSEINKSDLYIAVWGETYDLEAVVWCDSILSECCDMAECLATSDNSVITVWRVADRCLIRGYNTQKLLTMSTDGLRVDMAIIKNKVARFDLSTFAEYAPGLLTGWQI